MATQLLNTTRFGSVAYVESDVVHFAEGMIGFPKHQNFLLLSHKPESPFRWLQSIDEPQLAFLVASPESYVPDYAPALPLKDAEALSLTPETPRLVYVTVSIPAGNPQGMTLNLAGPLLINAECRQAKQLVLQDETYTTCHRVFPEACKVGAVAA